MLVLIGNNRYKLNGSTSVPLPSQDPKGLFYHYLLRSVIFGDGESLANTLRSRGKANAQDNGKADINGKKKTQSGPTAKKPSLSPCYCIYYIYGMLKEINVDSGRFSPCVMKVIGVSHTDWYSLIVLQHRNHQRRWWDATKSRECPLNVAHLHNDSENGIDNINNNDSGNDNDNDSDSNNGNNKSSRRRSMPTETRRAS